MLGMVTVIMTMVRENNEVLVEMTDDMPGRLDKVAASTATGKRLMLCGHLGFVCTMSMLVASVHMMPFTIFTPARQ